MRKTITLQVGQLASNCYIYQTSKENCIIIDPGDDGEYIIQKLLDNGLTPTAIFATHGHFDHIMAGFTLQAAYNVPFFINSEDTFLLERMRSTAIHFGEVDPGPEPIATFFTSTNFNKIVKSGEFEVINTPGHTPGCVSYLDKENGVIFVGDVLFSDGTIGEVTHKYSDRALMKKSIQKIISLPDETIVYPGHGECDTVENLKDKFEWALV